MVSCYYLYQYAHGFVYPSLYEGFGLPLLEAMQAGLPIAASTTPAVAEVTGDAALSFDPLNKDSIVAAIRALTCDGSCAHASVRQQERGWRLSIGA